ncbi:MAG: undecaprenyl-phosphate glucose phosphotransferase [Burkholderiales bacterium]|nr:undecaprenyl-phosphate glucose phosphotransferase [Burkholderiales bacterium]
MLLQRGALREYSSVFILLLRLADAVVIVAAASLAYFLKFRSWHIGQYEATSMLIAVLLANLIFAEMGVYRSWRAGSVAHEVGLLWLGWGLTFLLLTGLLFALKLGATYSREWIALWFFLTGMALALAHVTLRLALRWARKHGYNVRTLCIIGSGESATRAVQSACVQTSLGFKPVAWFGTHHSPLSKRVPTLGVLADLEPFVNAYAVDEVWIAVPLRDEHHLRAAFHALRHSTANIRYIPDLFGYELLNHTVTEIGGMPMMDLSVSPMQGVNRLVKRAEDLLLGSVFLLLASPVMLLIAAGVKLTSKGPVFYKQQRVGWNGQTFNILKFRSMPLDSEKEAIEWGAKGKQPTRLGAFLRKTSLDELPQLLNVMSGAMSIVGPRPERPMFVEQFKEEIPAYMKKHLVKAGITGWAQVNGWRGDTDLVKRIESDIYYINHWSLWLDIRIIFLTFFKGLVHKNAY